METVENVELALLNIVSAQTQQAAEFVGYVDAMKQYIRSAKMMSRVCVAGSDLGSDHERDVQALAHMLSEIEAWTNFQESMIQDNFGRIAFVNEVLQNAIAQAQSQTNEEPEADEVTE